MQLFAKNSLSVIFILATMVSFGQEELPLPMGGLPVRGVRQPGQGPANPSNMNPQGDFGADVTDSLGFTHRDDSHNRTTVTWRFLDSLRRHNMDSSVNDFNNYFPIPSYFNYLGNTGTAAYSIPFNPVMQAGWDAGFHAFDIYKFTVTDTRLYRSTKPFTSLKYELASGKEQIIQALHVQNPRPNFGFGFEYRLINAPGFFVNQNTNHNNYRFFTNYLGRKKRYRAQLMAVGNNLKSSENGGVVSDSSLQDPNKKKRFSVPVNMGGTLYIPSPFQTTVTTGNIYRDITWFFRQGFDLGRRDSLAINDSTMEFVYYPKFRLQHSFSYTEQHYRFRDDYADSTLYASWYGQTFPGPQDTFQLSEEWKILENDFSVFHFPDPSNTTRYLKAGVSYRDIASPGKPRYHNLILHGQVQMPFLKGKWNLALAGRYFPEGLNKGDYSLDGMLTRNLSGKKSMLQLHFVNVNRNPSFIFDSLSAFNLGNAGGFRKENITEIGLLLQSPAILLGIKNYLVSNYTWFRDYYHSAQYAKLFHVLQVNASGKLALARRWNWYLDATVQQTDGAAPVKLPLLYSRSRIAFEGVFFRNLNLSTGIEVRYCSPWKLPAYSPAMGAFIPQDTTTISNLPDVAAFLNFRIMGFTGFLRAENLNTASFSNGFSFTDNNFGALHYPTQGLMIRLGIKWWFVN